MAAMLFLCSARAVFIVRTDEDFLQLALHMSVYMGSDVSADLSAPMSCQNLKLDCVGHAITASQQLFGLLSGSRISNCTFRLRSQFASTLRSTTLTNTTIVSLDVVKSSMELDFSYFYSVTIQASAQFASYLTGTILVGCSFSLSVSQTTESQAFFQSLSSSNIQNSVVSANIVAQNSVSLAGLCGTLIDSRISGSRFISTLVVDDEFTGSVNLSRLGGCATEAYGAHISNSDFVTNIQVSGRYQMLGGVFAYIGTASEFSLTDVSSYLKLSGALKDASMTGSSQFVGNIAGSMQECKFIVKGLTAFNDVDFSFSTSFSTMYDTMHISGLVANLTQSSINISKCFVFGRLKAAASSRGALDIAGCFASINEKDKAEALIRNVVFSGEIIFTIQDKLDGILRVGGVAGMIWNATLVNSQFNGNISVFGPFSKSVNVGAIAGLVQGKQGLDSCLVTANISIDSPKHTMNLYVGGIAGAATSVLNSRADVKTAVLETDNAYGVNYIALLVGYATADLSNCSGTGGLSFETSKDVYQRGGIAGVIGYADNSTTFSNISVSGDISVIDGYKAAATAFGNISQSVVANIVIAVEVHGVSAKAYLSGGIEPTITNLFVDCSKEGNEAGQAFCKADLASEGAATELGAAFAWNAAYNGGYPYLAALPVLDAAHKYVLPDSGGFSADSYFVDNAGFSFPKVDFQPCRGVCYGVYSSPITRVCDDDFEYCVDVDRAIREFPDDSCIAENAVCSSGASFCNSQSEMLKDEATGEFTCQNTCFGCQNGYCKNGSCVCDIYSFGVSCVYKCDADQPVCFNDTALMCKEDNSKCVPIPSCDSMTCVHGTCIEAPIAHCECENLWAGDDCATCGGFGEDCNMTQEQCGEALCSSHGACVGSFSAPTCECDENFNVSTNCERCNAAMEVIDGSCACGKAGSVCYEHYFCASGSCEKDCTLLDYDCVECDSGNLAVCFRCKDGFSVKKGRCQDPKGLAIVSIVAGVVSGCVIIGVIVVVVFVAVKTKKSRNSGQSGPVSQQTRPHAESAAKSSRSFSSGSRTKVVVTRQQERLNEELSVYPGASRSKNAAKQAELQTDLFI